MPAMTTFSVEPLVEARIAEFTRIEEAAFGYDALQNLMFPPEATVNSYEAWAVMTCQRKLLHDPTCRLMTATSLKTGELMAGSRWNFYDRPEDFEKTITKASRELDTPQGSNPELYRMFKDTMNNSCTKQMRGEAFYRLSLLVTHPKYQRQGAGTALVNFGTNAADALGLPCYLEASPTGYGLYKKFGFQRVGELNIDLRPYGVEETWTAVVMVRPAKPKPA